MPEKQAVNSEFPPQGNPELLGEQIEPSLYLMGPLNSLNYATRALLL